MQADSINEEDADVGSDTETPQQRIRPCRSKQPMATPLKIPEERQLSPLIEAVFKSNDKKTSYTLIQGKSKEMTCRLEIKRQQEEDRTASGCSCNFGTLLQISECPAHPNQTPPLKMPNLMKAPEDCTILMQGWVKKKTTNIFLGFQERYLVLYSNKKLVYYKLLK